MRRVCIASFMLALASPLSATPPCSGSSLLLHVDFAHEILLDFRAGVRSTTYRSVYVCRNGLVNGATTPINSAFPFNTPASIFRTTQLESLRSLSLALRQNKVAQQASCSFLADPRPLNQPLLWEYITVRWYGKGTRSREFSYDYQVFGSSPDCSSEAVTLLDAIRTFTEASAKAGDGEFYPISSGPWPRLWTERPGTWVTNQTGYMGDTPVR